MVSEVKLEMLNSLRAVMDKAYGEQKITAAEYLQSAQSLERFKEEFKSLNVNYMDRALDTLLEWIRDEPDSEDMDIMEEPMVDLSEVLFENDEGDDDGYIPF
jgi:hypothetical protein